MYSRLQKDTLVDEPTRQKLLKYIYSEPGANFKQLKDKFSLHNGTLAHHINILENHDIITSHRSEDNAYSSLWASIKRYPEFH